MSDFAKIPPRFSDTDCALREVGRPIHVVQCDKPSLEEIRHVQEQYIDELMWCVFLFGFLWRRRPLKAVRRIWNTYKDDFARTRTRELSIIE